MESLISRPGPLRAKSERDLSRVAKVSFLCAKNLFKGDGRVGMGGGREGMEMEKMDGKGKFSFYFSI